MSELDRTQWAWLAVIAAGTIIASTTLVVYLARNGWTQVGDEANQIYGARRAFRDWPLLGDLNTSNFYGNPESHHPGPMAWYLLAPWVRELGPQLGAWVFAVSWNTAWIALTGWFAFRIGGTKVGGACLVLSFIASTHALDGRWASVFFQDLPLLPVLFCLVGAWALARGDSLVLPFLVFASTFVVQAATLNLPLVAMACAGGMAMLVVRARRDPPLPNLSVHLWSSAAIAAVLWAPPVWDQISGTGNFGLLLRADLPHGGLSNLPNLIETSGVSVETIAVALLVLGCLAALAKKRPAVSLDPATLAVTTAVALGAAVTMAQIPGEDVEKTHWFWVPMVSAFLAIVLVDSVTIDGSSATIRSRLMLAIGMVAILANGDTIFIPSTWSSRTTSMNAVVALEPSSARLGGPLPYRLASRGALIGTAVAQGLSPLWAAGGHPVGGFGGPPFLPNASLLVVTNNEPNPIQKGRVIDVFRPPVPAGVGSVPARIDSFVRGKGTETRLVPHTSNLLVSILDGLVPSFCADDMLEDPSSIRDLGPEVLARLYGLGLVDQPALPADLASDAQRWLAAQPVALIQLPGAEAVSNERIWSEDTC